MIHFKYNTIYDEKIVINLINIFSNIYSKIQKGNELAHSIIKDKSFIESIIDISKNTGDENDFSNIIKIFKDEKTEELISSISIFYEIMKILIIGIIFLMIKNC